MQGINVMELPLFNAAILVAGQSGGGGDQGRCALLCRQRAADADLVLLYPGQSVISPPYFQASLPSLV